jgi:hypothetical protein
VSADVISRPPGATSVPRSLRRMEAWAAAAPLLCAAHCMAAPLVLALAPRLAPGEAAERAVLAGSILLAGAAAALGRRVHRRRAPLLVVLAGALLWLAGLAALLPEEPATIGASLLLAVGTLWSARLRHTATCHRCGCGAHSHAEHAPRATSSHPARGGVLVLALALPLATQAADAQGPIRPASPVPGHADAAVHGTVTNG